MMADAVLRAMGIDPVQFRALLLLSLRVDFRTGLFSSNKKKKSAQSRKGLPGLWQIPLFYGFLGLVMSFTIIENANIFFTGSVLITIGMFAVAMSVLVEFQSVIVSPEDFHILAPRPVNSRTFFAARMTNLMIYIGVMTLAIGIVPALLYTFLDGFRPLLGIASMLGMFGASVLITLFIIFLYVNLMRVVHPKKLKRIFSYLQLVLSFLVYGSGMIFSTMLNSGELSQVMMTQEPWTLLLPSTWFVSLMLIVTGDVTFTTALSLGFGGGLTAMLLVYSYGKLSLEYAALLSRLSEASEPASVARRVPGPLAWFRHGEGRAAALLIHNQFKHDHKFRMAVLAIVPLTVLYLLTGLAEGHGLADPFVDPGRHVQKANLLYFAMAFFPVLLMASMARSDSYQASWIFHVTPSDKGKIVLAVKDVLVIFFIFPYVLGLGVVFSIFFESFLNVVIHVFMLGIISHLILQVLVVTNPFLPFSRPIRKGERTAGVFIGIIVAALSMTIIINILARLIYPSETATAVTLVVLALLTLLFERFAATRVRRMSSRLQYDY
jgi:ABC-2 type transport system permease protein